MPITGANIIEIQLAVRNCGSSPSRPRGMRPKPEAATMITKIVKTVAAMTYSQPKFEITPLSTSDPTSPNPGGISPRTTEAIPHHEGDRQSAGDTEHHVVQPGVLASSAPGRDGAEVLEELLGRLRVLAHEEALRSTRSERGRSPSWGSDEGGRTARPSQRSDHRTIRRSCLSLRRR